MPHHHWRLEKIITVEHAETRAAELRQQGRKLVTVNGAFDLFHAGHLDFLEEAKKQGDILFIGLNSDESVRQGKGPKRPYVPEQERAALLTGLICVDYVIIIDAPYREVQNVLLRTVKPHIHVNGSEYGVPAQWIEWPVMQEVGAQGYVVERRASLSTTDLVTKIQFSIDKKE